MLYIGVGNGTPWNRDIRSPGGGDNLYLSSIVAINPDDGSMAWHYQTTPGETWDYTATQHMILADIEIDGAVRKVIMQAPKNGFFYVLDRTDGTFISAQAYVPVNWASHIDPATGRPVEIPAPAIPRQSSLSTRRRMAATTGIRWPTTPTPATSISPRWKWRFPTDQAPDFQYLPGEFNTGIDITPLLPPKTIEGQVEVLQSMKGHLAAWDPVAQREVWRVQHPTTWNGGLLSTAGNLVFQGRPTATSPHMQQTPAHCCGKPRCIRGSSPRRSPTP